MAGYRRLIAGIGLLGSLLVLAGQNGQGSQNASKDHPGSSGFVLPQKPRSRLTPAEERGQTLYAYYCALCHGKTGKGDGFNSYNLTVSPRDFTNRAEMAVLSDSQIEKAILEGGAALGLSPLMQAWGGVLTKSEASDLRAFLRTLAGEDGGKR